MGESFEGGVFVERRVGGAETGVGGGMDAFGFAVVKELRALEDTRISSVGRGLDFGKGSRRVVGV